MAIPSTTPGDAGDVALKVSRPEWEEAPARVDRNGLRDYIYFIRRGTLQGLAYAAGADAGDFTPPVILTSGGRPQPP
jgi:hypothetical protein